MSRHDHSAPPQHCCCRYAPEKIPYAVERYTKEVKRLLGVLEDRLKGTGGPYIMGQDYTIAGGGRGQGRGQGGGQPLMSFHCYIWGGGCSK
jgi:hypothetical protein